MESLECAGPGLWGGSHRDTVEDAVAGKGLRSRAELLWTGKQCWLGGDKEQGCAGSATGLSLCQGLLGLL